MPHATAAVELLIADQHWLTREDFLGRFVWTGRAGVGDLWLAIVDWPAVVAALDSGQLPYAPDKGRVLRIAASLAGTTMIDLRHHLAGLDATTITVIAASIGYAGGGRRLGDGRGQA